MIHNVVIGRRIAATNIDSYNRAAKHSENLDNGSVFALEAVDTTEKLVWTVKAPTAEQEGLWMALTPEVVYQDKTHGGTVDPRDFENIANRVMDATLLVPKDVIEMTGAGIENISTSEYLVGDTGFVLKASATAATNGICLHKIGTNTLKVGDGALAPAAIPMYVYEVIKN